MQKTNTKKSEHTSVEDRDKNPEELLRSSGILDMRQSSVSEKPGNTQKEETPDTENSHQAKIVFFGTPKFAVPSLEKLIEKQFNIVGVVTQPDKKKNKAKEASPSPIKEVAVQHDITVYQPKKIDAEFLTQIQELNPDIIVTVAYGKILPGELMQTPPFQALNVHPSLLPKYRGASPIQNALLEGEKITGTTIMLMDEGMDTGDILEQKTLQIGENELYESLEIRLAQLSADLLVDVLPQWLSGDIQSKPQQNNEATHCQLIEKEDGRVFWNEPAQNIYNKHRAFSQWPGIFTFWKNGQALLRVKLLDIQLEMQDKEPSKRSFGEIFEINNAIAVQAQRGFIILRTIQLEGKKPLGIEDFLKGYPDFLKSKLQ